MTDERDQSTVPAQSRAGAAAGGASRPEDLAQAVGVGGQSRTRAVSGGRRTGPRPAFDAHHPPSLQLIDDCVHCGFCLPSCPTYLLWGEEMDSPRGRIYLMREGLEGEALNDAMVRHFDQCLGCLACVTACPSGVQYEKLIESTRAQVERRYSRSLADRFMRELIYAFFPHPRRLALVVPALRLYQRSGMQRRIERSALFRRLPTRLRAAHDLVPDVTSSAAAVPTFTPARGSERRRVGLLLGCVQRAFFSSVNTATARVLAADGCAVVAPPDQGCCGALSEHVGREREALDFARRTIDTFERAGVDLVAVNVAGCGSMMKEYGYLLRDDPAYADRARAFSERVRDVSELLCELGPVAERRPLELSVVYHDACHLLHGQKISQPPRELLRQIPGLTVREVPRERDICCGSAGTYNLLQPTAGRELGDRKARNVLDAGAQLLVTANPGCHLQIQAGLRRLGHRLPAAHVMDVLDASLRGRQPSALLR